jgi:putative ABC transport system permease protein
MNLLNLRHLAPLIEEALIALNANRLRSSLTMLGVVIGVASVILMLAIGEGSRKKVAESIVSLGSNQLIVMSGSANTGGFRGGSGSLPNLKLQDASAIGELYSVRAVAPVSSSAAQVVWGAKNKSTTVTGTTPAYFLINNMSLTAGALFTDADVRIAANVAILGATVYRDLFGEQQAIGQTFRIQRQTFQVIGVLKAKGQGFGGQDQDDVVILPVTTAQRKLAGTPFPGSVSTILVESRFPDQKGYAEQEVTRLLRQLHRIAPGAEDDFSVRDMSALSETLQLTSTILSVLLGAIAFISLLVGGIGIMNIMLVSVTERTREIGVRMAVGARRASVLSQFLIESIFLSFAGAVVGLLLGIGSGWLASRTGAVTAIYSGSSIALALGVAIGVGVGFGFWPARRASQLQPVEALRYQ